LPTNNGLDWKGLPGTNTLADYKKVYNIGACSMTSEGVKTLKVLKH